MRLVTRGDLSGAMKSAEKSLEIDETAPEVHNLMGFIRAHEGRAEEAVEHYERAIELDESFVEAMLNAAEVKLHPLRDWDGAIAMIDEALDWIDDAEETADRLQRDADDYCDRRLADFEIDLGKVLSQVQAGRAKLAGRLGVAED